jgi:hypothetical protein
VTIFQPAQRDHGNPGLLRELALVELQQGAGGKDCSGLISMIDGFHQTTGGQAFRRCLVDTPCPNTEFSTWESSKLERA